MFRGIPKTVWAAAAVLGALGLAYFAASRPWYFNQTYLGGLILLEFLAAAVWKFRQVFFPILIMAFLLAGVDLPTASVWTSARWVFLSVGALVGLVMLLKDRQQHFGIFHGVALFAVLAAAVSAMVSQYPTFALLKVLSLGLLFLYGASGARLAVRGREARFFAGLLLGCELFVGSMAVFYFVARTGIMGNPNSLGAVTGVVCAPLLLWGALIAPRDFVRRRRLVMFLLCIALVYYSYARAGMVAAALSCGLLCFGLRRYRFLIAGTSITLILFTAAVIVRPELVFQTASSVTSEVIYKGRGETGVLASRASPWQDAMDSIRDHFWFGTGFGTSDPGNIGGEHLGNFSSTSEVTTEYGSSYLEIATWVGILGVLPFLILIVVLVRRVSRTVLWMLAGGDPSHPAIPLAMVVVAGMLHAAFEDWMFAPGYYLCVFFWSVAFILVDLAPARARLPVAHAASWPARSALDAAAPTR